MPSAFFRVALALPSKLYYQMFLENFFLKRCHYSIDTPFTNNTNYNKKLILIYNKWFARASICELVRWTDLDKFRVYSILKGIEIMNLLNKYYNNFVPIGGINMIVEADE
ncbi:hypothetical protein DMUE_5563, partial [Dictyocoela muelleri]